MSDHDVGVDPVLLDGGASPAGWSRAGTIAKCLRFAGLKYGRRESRDGLITPVAPQPALNVPSLPQAEGIVVHTGLAHHYALLGIEQSGEVLAADEVYTDASAIMSAPDAIAVASANMRAAHGFEIDVSRLTDCYYAYAENYRYDQWIVLGVETIVSADIEDPERVDEQGNPIKYLYTARVDVIWSSAEHYESDRRIYFADHKGFAGQSIGPKSPTILGYSSSGQIHGLGWLGRYTLGDKFGGVMLNMVGRNPPYKFARPPLDSAVALVKRFPQTIIDLERRLADAEASGVPPRDWTPAANDTVCVGRYGVCPAWEKKLCQW